MTRRKEGVMRKLLGFLIAAAILSAAAFWFAYQYEDISDRDGPEEAELEQPVNGGLGYQPCHSESSWGPNCYRQYIAPTVTAPTPLGIHLHFAPAADPGTGR